MHRGKGMKFVGDSRVLRHLNENRIFRRIIRNTLVKRKHSGLTSF